MIVVRIFHGLFLLRLRADAETRLPILLNGGWKLIHVCKKRGDLPDVVIRQSFVPGGHAGVTDASANGVKDVPLGVVGRIRDEVWRRRIKRGRESGRLAVEASVTKGAIHGVELHTLNQI